jgi:hypothetical protein
MANGPKKTERAEYELLKPIKQAGELKKPAAEGEPVIKVRLRKEQGDKLAESGHVKMAA